MGVGNDTDETEDALLDRREDEMEGVTVEAFSKVVGAFTPLREA
jgi:hypothetical protein